MANETYVCSEYISNLLGLDESEVISFEDFNRRILQEHQRHTTIHSFGLQQMPEIVYLLDTVKGPVWVRSKISFQVTNEKGNTLIYGVAEMQDVPNMATAYQALQRSERLLNNYI